MVVAWAVCAMSVAAYLVVRHLIHPSMIDLLVYRVEGRAVRDGVDLYGPLDTPKGLRATYPPFAAVVFVPLSLLSTAALRIAGVAGNLVLLFVVVRLSLRLADPAGRLRADVAVPVVAAVALWFEPVFTTFRLGQVNLAVLALVLWDLTRRPGARLRGAAVGVAAGLKVTPAIFVAYLFVTGRRREAVTATAAWAATVALSAAVTPGSTRRFWTHLVFESDRVGRLENAVNQSPRGLLTRVTGSAELAVPGALFVAAVALAALGCAVVAYRRGGDAWGLPCCAVGGLLVSPISWSHHWVWCVPIAVLLWARAEATRSRADLAMAVSPVVFLSFVVLAVPHRPGDEWHLNPGQLLMSASYVVFGTALAFFAVRAAGRPAGHAVEPGKGRRLSAP